MQIYANMQIYAHLLKPNLNIFYFQDGRESAIFKFVNLTF